MRLIRLRRKSILLSLIALLLSFAVWSCEDTVSGGGGGSSIVFPDSGVSYGRHVQPLFDQTCAFISCHGSDTFTQRGFSLESYDHLMFGTTVVILRRFPDDSPLVWRIEGRPGFARMPLNRTPLTDNQIRGMRRWILDGAQNN